MGKDQRRSGAAELERPGGSIHVVMASGAFVAAGVPTVLAAHLPPSATFLNQAAAFVGWGIWLVYLVQGLPRGAVVRHHGLAACLWAIGALMMSALLAPLTVGSSSSLSLSAVGLIAGAAIAFLVAIAVEFSRNGRAVFDGLCIALVVAGLISSLVGIVQVYAPDWTGTLWLAPTALEGRAVGNLRQPNHLATLLVWSVVAAVRLWGSNRWPVTLSAVAWTVLLFGLVLTASRTGMVGATLLGVWGFVDRRLGKPVRRLLWLTPLLYILLWTALTVDLPARMAQGAFHGAERLQGDISSSRFAIWTNTLSLIAANPWFGVGWGEFNFAWTLTPFANRPTAFFDHTHNLPLQLAVELGLPLATLILALLAYALWSAFKAARDADEHSAYLRPAFVMVLMIAVHSMLEYPLWYAYFLLPTAFVWGLCLGGPSNGAGAPAPPAAALTAEPPTPRRTRPLLIGAMLLIAGGIYSVIDYWKVVVIFDPPPNAAPLSQRILDGRKSIFFGHHADYADATSVPEPGNVMPAFRTATHYLLDTRLMMAWAKAYAAHGDLDRARHLAARLREFRNPASDEFFAPCDAPADPAAPKPFQCEPPSKVLSFRDFR